MGKFVTKGDKYNIILMKFSKEMSVSKVRHSLRYLLHTDSETTPDMPGNGHSPLRSIEQVKCTTLKSTAYLQGPWHCFRCRQSAPSWLEIRTKLLIVTKARIHVRGVG